MYRTDLFEAAGLTMPEAPTWEFIGEAARKITDREAGINGICLRGKAGWGENMALIGSMANSFGARWFDEEWKAQFDSPEWKETLQFYADLMADAGPSGASSNGFNENLTLFQQGKCGIWIDATSAGSFVSNPNQSTVADKVAYTIYPNKEGVDNHGNWLWSWNLAIPTSSKNAEAAKTFIAWATNKEYTELVAEKEGWANVPPGTRTSLYENQDYLDAAAFADEAKAAMDAADITKPTVQPVPYTGGQFVAIPEFQSIGTTVGQLFSAVLAGQSSVDDALAQAQSATEREMRRAGY
jgi:sorbitol/mannitol transport system substrate-binding protein